MNDVQKQRQLMSDLIDGQLQGEAFAVAVELAATQEDARECWHVYHVVGDVLRSADLAKGDGDLAFVARLRARLDHESAVGASPRPNLPAAASIVSGSLQGAQRAAANAPVFRWKLVAGFASLVALAAVSWQLVGARSEDSGGAQLARATPNGTQSVFPVDGSTVADVVPVVVRDPRLDELLAAHRQFGGASALQNPSGFLRNATFEGGRD